MLPEDKQRRRLSEFFDLLRMVRKPLVITLDREPATVHYGNTNQTMEILHVRLQSDESLDDILEKIGFSHTIDDAPPPIVMTRESPAYFECQLPTAGNTRIFGRAYTIHGAPSMLPPAWIASVFGGFHRVQMQIKSVRTDDAIKKIQTRELLYAGTKSRRADMQKKLMDMQNLRRQLELGNTNVFTFTVNGFLFTKSLKELKRKHTLMRRHVASMNVRVTASLGRQLELLQGGGATWLSATDGMSVLYPFASSDMIEAPSGIPLGKNKDSGGPVIYDINQRKNHNVFTAGTTGSGKSFTNKIILKRFLEQRPSTTCIVIDPQGEYIEYADYFGLDALEVRPGERYGLDPFSLFENKIEAVDLLGSATAAPNEIRREWRSMSEEINSVQELHKRSSAAGKKYLADLVKGQIAEVLQGEPRFSDRMIVSLKHTDGQEYEGMLIMLVLAYAWKRVNELPASRWKFVLLDEAWRMTKIEQSVKKIGEMARQGRKKSLIFAVSTQQFSDMDRALDDDSRLTELFDTKIIMQMSQSAARRTGQSLELTDAEVERIAAFRTGNGMIQTSSNSIYLKFEATEDERHKYFNTKAEKE